MPQRQQRWTHPGKNSLNDWNQLPKGWNYDEPDLDPQDIEAQIQRCKDRIEDNIMPYLFSIRLKVFEEAKINRDALVAPYQGKGLSWSLIQRLECLKGLKEDLLANGDAFEELPNVESIIAAYESGDLKLDGQITYWSYGKFIHRSNTFDWNEFKTVNRIHQGFKGFWVEGRGEEPGPTSVNSYKAICSADSDGQYVIPLVLRLGQDPMQDKNKSKLEPEIEFDFIDDTGCGPLKIYTDDVAILQGPNVATGVDWPWPQMIGYEPMKSADGTVSYILAIMVEVNIYNKPKGRADRQLGMPAWVPAVALVDPGKSVGPAGPNERLSGHWLRSSLFTATAPGSNQCLYISSTKTGLLEKDMLPRVDVKDIRPMRLVRSRYLVGSRRVQRKPRIAYQYTTQRRASE
ncbi:hypothetical protein N7454_010332 [Penicillium verhagenii]|nr:hypothetical protein N7454_010332 [Penicillium verhagenii]